MTTGPHPQLEVIDRDECLRLLAGDEIGRLAVIAGNTPVVLPINYALDGETVVFRTDPGTKLDHGPRARASFEVDCFDRASDGRAGAWWPRVAWRRSRSTTRPRSSGCGGWLSIRGRGATRRIGCAWCPIV